MGAMTTVRGAVSRLFSGAVSTTRSAGEIETRAAPRRYGALSHPYDANITHPAIPAVPVVGPEGALPYLREQQALARHMLRNYAWIRSAFRAMRNNVVGRGPRPVSKFRDLEILWEQASGQFDNRGRNSFGAWLRDDVYGNFLKDGEAFVRTRFRYRRPDLVRQFGLVVPVQFQALQSAFCPLDNANLSAPNGMRYLAGIGTYYDRPVAYRLYDHHPNTIGWNGTNSIFTESADFVAHLVDSETGSPRGEVMLASCFLRAIAMSTLEDAEIRRKQIASIMTVFFKQSMESADLLSRGVDDEGQDILPNAERVDEMLRAARLGTGLVHQLPPGYDVTPVQAQDEPENFEKALRWQIMAMAAAFGLPLYQVTGDYKEVPERAMRIAMTDASRNVDVERDRIEHQVLNRRVWPDFVEAAWSSGQWTPPAGATMPEILRVEWEWPVFAQAALTQELNSMVKLVQEGAIPPSYIPQAYLGMRYEDVTRQSAKDYARMRENGLMMGDQRWDPERSDTSRSIMAEATTEETEERRKVDEAARDTLRIRD